MKKHQLERIHILIADGDAEMASITAQNLRAMSFQQVRHVRNGKQALEHLAAHPVDILITEWLMPQMNGVELVRAIRRSNNLSNRTLPIIMLTGKGEEPDVTAARDCGITEFVVKPFTACTLYARIEQLVEHPRGFVLSSAFVGPDRRRRSLPVAESGQERRAVKPVTVSPRAALPPDSGVQPTLILPDPALKITAGLHEPLSSIITQQVLEKAQKDIEAMGDVCLQWIKEDLGRLESAYADADTSPLAAIEAMKEAALSIKSRAGTFGYRLATNIARQLYLFLASDYRPGNPPHRLVVRKHLDTLKVVFASGLKEHEGMGQELALELQRLIHKQR